MDMDKSIPTIFWPVPLEEEKVFTVCDASRTKLQAGSQEPIYVKLNSK